MFGRRSNPPVDNRAVGTLSREELAGLVTAARAVNAARSTTSILDTILAEAIRLLGAHEGSVMVFEPDRTHLRIRAARGLPTDVVDRVKILPGRGIAGHVAASGESLVVNSEEDVARYATVTERSRRLRSAVCVPLRTHGVVEGVLNINLLDDDAERPGFTDRDRALAALFAEHAASAIHNHQLVSQARQRRDEIARLFEVSYALSTTLDVNEIARSILDAAGELLGSSDGFVCVVGEEGNGPEIGVYRGVTRGRVMAAMRHPEFAQLLRSNGVRAVAVHRESCLRPLGGDDVDTAVVASLTADGETRGFVVSLCTDRSPSDSDLRLLGTYANHASLALAKALAFRSIRTKEHELESLVRAVPDPMIVADASGRFIAFNPAAAEQFGLNPQFDIGSAVAGKLRSEELEALLFSERGGHGEITLFTPSPRTYLVRVDLVRPDHGLVGARILILRDVTAEREMAQLQADFLAVVGHELRTPLTLIKGYASTMSRRPDLDGEVRMKAVGAIHTHAVRLERLVEDLLFVANIERGAPPLALERADVVAVLQGVVQATQQEHPDRHIIFRSDAMQLAMEVDTTKIEQILHHLLDNALKFSEAPDPVEVSVVSDDEDVVLEVVDRGAGIFSGDLPHLFDRFHQVDGTATREHGGTGVGLHICKTLAEAHGGRIAARSALGKGSTFTVRLPRFAADRLLDIRGSATRAGDATSAESASTRD